MSHRKSGSFELVPRRAWILLAAFAVIGLLAGCAASLPVPTRDDARAPLSLLPQPASVERSPGYFSLRRGAPLILRTDNAQALGVARYFIELAQRTHGLHLDLRPLGARPPGAGDADDAIVFVLDPNFPVTGDEGVEGYELSVSTRGVRLQARTPRGLFYGAVTLWQLLGASGSQFPLQIPAVAIADHPRFAWRGVMLDSARQYQSLEFIKHFIDTLALHKLNVLHWHLTDDQGWRIEIKKYPKLTDVGAWRIPASAGGPQAPRYGGFYTQEQIREIVRYAAERFITIVPEIEMPGHAQAAIAAYPELGVSGKPVAVSHDWGIHTYLYNVDESTFTFLENVLTEVIDLFPGTYIHVGGDEAAKDQWQASPQVRKRMRELGVADETALQSYFISRIERFLGAHGRKLIGWDEILQGGLPPRATVMSWRGTQGGIDAARLGHDVVMSPSPPMYFDHVQSQRHDEPPGRPDVVSLADVYAYEPLPSELDKAQAQHVLGAQANLWSEYMDTTQRVEHAAFPRVAALAEVVWSPRSRHSWTDFLARLPAQQERYRALGVQFAQAASAVDAATKNNLRNSDQLLPCNPGKGLALRLPGPGLAGNDGVYNVDIFDPCWIYPQVDLDAVRSLAVVAARLPYNFQLWKDAKKIVLRKPATAAGELQVRLDRCDGGMLFTIPLGQATGTTRLEATLAPQHGTHDVCFVFTRAAVDPMWAIDSVQWLP